ncbi:MAG: hypothetical protein WBA76_01980 [Phormidesmis sp.]
MAAASLHETNADGVSKDLPPKNLPPKNLPQSVESSAPPRSHRSPLIYPSDNRFSRQFSYQRRSPYAIIAAARSKEHLAQFRSWKQPVYLIDSVKQIRPAIKKQVHATNRYVSQMSQKIKAALSHVLDQVSSQIHHRAEQLRQP